MLAHPIPHSLLRTTLLSLLSGLLLASTPAVASPEAENAQELDQLIQMLQAERAYASPEAIPEGIGSALIQRSKSLTYALSLIGSPYRRGGSEPAKGIDCSGFVRHVYRQSDGIDLPHNASQMSHQGITVARDALEPGDLVFFNTLRKPFSHVGIYLGEGKFVHASSSRSRKVMVSYLDENYWKTRFNGARRILDRLR